MNEFAARQAIVDYYRAEHVAGPLALFGLVLLSIGAFLLFKPGFRRGLGAALLLFAAVLTGGGGIYYLSLARREQGALELLKRDPPAWKLAEGERLRGVVGRFTPLRGFDAGLVLVGLGLAVGGRKRPSWVGFGTALSLGAFGLYAVETHNLPRAQRYLGFIEGFEARPKLGLDPNRYATAAAFYERLQIAVRQEERAYVARCFAYPLRSGPLELNGPGDLLHHYDEIFSVERRYAIQAGRTEASEAGGELRGTLLLSACTGESGCPRGATRVVGLATAR